MDDIAERIDRLRTAHHLTQSEFADKCEIKRSILSHILSGRNKPSLSVIQQILEGFPEVATDWLLFGKGEMKGATKSHQHPTSPPKSEKTIFKQDSTPQNAEGFREKAGNVPSAPKSQPAPPLDFVGDNNNKILKIICFYQDGSFSEHQPR
ncbi:MAG: helix-turn-helix domain-containing protein [Schleiferiaceae bacterium]|nr:helix-turn-helix domain-containing protein [Schleiferiaceae bacterium]